MEEQVPEYPHPDGTPVMDQSPVGPNAKFPVGLIFIVILTGMAMLGSLSTVVNPMIIIGVYVVTGFPAFVFGVIQMGVYITLFVWFIKRKEQGRVLGIVVSVYQMLLMAFNFLSIVYLPNRMMAAYDTVMPGFSEMLPFVFLSLIFGLMTILGWSVGASVILYLHFKKQHFRE